LLTRWVFSWILYSCYPIIDTPTLRWSEARTRCQNLGGDLSISDNAFVLDLVKKQGTVMEWGTWLGLAGLKFCWIDKTSQSGKYSQWNTGKPNSPTEKCGHLFGTGPNAGKCGITSHAIWRTSTSVALQFFFVKTLKIKMISSCSKRWK